jgi:hypothetical protein
MNYQKIYNQIIERAKTRQLEGYKEKHHIIPKCLGGSNDKENLVELTAREHFLCHMLLCEIYPKEPKLWYALHLMSINKNKKYTKYKVSSRMYEYIKNNTYSIKRPHSEETKQKLRKPKPEGFGENISKKLTGIKRSEETKQKISQSSKGKTRHTEEFKDFISKVHKNKNISEETKYKIGESVRQRVVSKETRQKMSLSRKGNNHTEETKKKISQSKKDQHPTEETKIKIKNSKLGKPTKKSQPVNQYDLKGNFIKTWDKIKEASIAIGKPLDTASITCCCRGKQKTAFGYIWKYKINLAL